MNLNAQPCILVKLELVSLSVQFMKTHVLQHTKSKYLALHNQMTIM